MGIKIVEIVLKIPTWLERPALFLVLLYRRLRYGYTFRKIPLTQGKFAIVDSHNYDRLRKYKWHAQKNIHTFYAVRSLTNGKKEKRKNEHMHHLVIDIPDGMVCDHINHNGLDNRMANLRPVTHMQNVWNRRKFKSSSRSRYKGVDFAKDMKRWRARIRVNGRRIYLGSYENEIDAAKAYDKAAKKYHGPYAAINFPRR
ncbi:MAG: AP2 domain-containing protein [Planctomycetota bacterium]